MANCTQWSQFAVVTYNAVTIREHAVIEIHKTELKITIYELNQCTDKTDKVVL